ncbi:hypothetical protein [Capsulimonas corticalis]|uniref:hypothetical protein n=1 Tax=Capsulimonas corticalis TaxID=2219043 RepID=UPI000F64EF3B|nr:hypothetical protein [Capsulimonas corticalis]
MKNDLEQRGYCIFELDGRCVHDKSSFLAQAAVDLPQPIELISLNKWDAFQDSIYMNLLDIKEPNVAIIWNDAQEMLKHGL